MRPVRCAQSRRSFLTQTGGFGIFREGKTTELAHTARDRLRPEMCKTTGRGSGSSKNCSYHGASVDLALNVKASLVGRYSRGST